MRAKLFAIRGRENLIGGASLQATILISNSLILSILSTVDNSKLVVLLTNQKDYEHCAIKNLDIVLRMFAIRDYRSRG